MDYSLCRQTVTIYRCYQGQILRQVVEGCYLERRHVRFAETLGSREDHNFLLVIPGETQRVFPGDRVLEGIGPEITLAQWEQFLPVNVPGLVEVLYTKPYVWEGKLCHVEAGRKTNGRY